MIIAFALALAVQSEDPRTLTAADFQRPPAPEVPAAALSRQIPRGSATVECVVQDTEITGCIVVDEDPPGLRFGAMLVSEMRRARLKPEVAAEVSRFRLTAVFRTSEG